MKTAFITGITGQDGAYLASLLLSKGYTVIGGYHNGHRGIEKLQYLGIEKEIELVEIDLFDTAGLKTIISKFKPTEVYNLAAQSFVYKSFEEPLHTGNVTGLGVHNILDAIRMTNIETRFYQASSSEIFGHAKVTPQNESTPFHPRSPYGIAKLYAHWATVNYRESYDIFAVAGILFNHESPLRGKEFVTKKIARSVARISEGLQDHLEIGALDVKRDWGYAPEYVEGMWKMLQNTLPKDYVLSTGENHSVREWIEACFALVDIAISWEGQYECEVGRNLCNGQLLVKVNPAFYRPTEINALVGDSSLASRELDWNPKVKFNKLVEIMMMAELQKVRSITNNQGLDSEN